MDNTPLLSVCLITYNHEKFVRQALEGIFMQKVDFPIEVIIADDCSTDSTRNIILEYKEKYPEIIKLIFQEKNVGPAKNWMDLITAPKSKYIAYFEGDDYWTEPLKLQKQVDFLEANEDFSICFHNIEVLENGSLTNYCTNIEKNTTYSFVDLAKNNLIATLSAVYRNTNSKLPIWFSEMPIGDYPFHLLHAKNGKIYCFAENMGVYRKGVGVWSSKSSIDIANKTLQTIEMILQFIPMELGSQIEMMQQYLSLQKTITKLKFPNIPLQKPKIQQNKYPISLQNRIINFFKRYHKKIFSKK